MLSDTQIQELRERLEQAQNPLFFFDNDADGLCSFLLLRRWLGRGKGVVVKSFPDLHVDYVRKVHELSVDMVVILDKPTVSEAFFSEIRKINLPLLWVDHHAIEGRVIPEDVFFVNPADCSPQSFEPVTDICYRVAGRKEDIWLAVAGCVADHYVPLYYPEFLSTYPELGKDSEDPFVLFFSTDIGKIARMFNYGLMDRVTNVLSMIRFLVRVQSPQDVLIESYHNHSFHKRFLEINHRREKLLKKAQTLVEDSPLLFFTYGGDMSMSSEIANELIYLYPDKHIVVVYLSGEKGNVSVRGKRAKEITLAVIAEISGATGGGHDEACGAQVHVELLHEFHRRFLEALGEKKKHI